MHRLIQQKIVGSFRDGDEVWFNRTESLRSRAVPYDDDLVDDLMQGSGTCEVIAKTKKGLQAGKIVDNKGLWFDPDEGRQFRIQWDQVYGLILETHSRDSQD